MIRVFNNAPERRALLCPVMTKDPGLSDSRSIHHTAHGHSHLSAFTDLSLLIFYFCILSKNFSLNTSKVLKLAIWVRTRSLTAAPFMHHSLNRFGPTLQIKPAFKNEITQLLGSVLSSSYYWINVYNWVMFLIASPNQFNFCVSIFY